MEMCLLKDNHGMANLQNSKLWFMTISDLLPDKEIPFSINTN